MNRSVSKFLARGGRALGLAAVARAKGHRASEIEWHALGADLGASAKQVMGAIESEHNPSALAQALYCAMDKAPATGIPQWAIPIVENLVTLEEIGEKVSVCWPPGSKGNQPASTKMSGLAACAIALCRSADAVGAVALKLPNVEDRQSLSRMAALAHVLVAPGEPSGMKSKIEAAVGVKAAVEVKNRTTHGKSNKEN